MLRDFRAVFRLDLAEVLRSRWLLVAVAVNGVVGGLFVLVGMRESALLGFSGIGRVMLAAAHALLVILPLLALSATVQVINRARDDGSLEFLFSQPIRRGAFFGAVACSRYLAMLLPLVAMFLGLAAVARFGFGQALPWSLLWRSVGIAAALVAAFTGLGLLISTVVRSQARAVTWSVVSWMASAALLDFALVGVLLQWRLEPQLVFALASINPVQLARMALLSAAEPELSLLGPVGFFLTERLGAELLLLIGILGPALFGLLASATALRRFSRGDVV